MLDDVIDNVIEIISAKLAQKGLSFHLQMPNELCPPFVGDASRIQQLLLNLLTNAVTYTNKGSITVKIDSVPIGKAQSMLLFNITDTGNGIGEQAIKGVVSKATDSVLTPGIGLTFCCNLLQLMESQLSVESQPNIGSTFSFCIPLDNSSQQLKANENKWKVAVLSSQGTFDTLTEQLGLLGHSAELLPLSIIDSKQECSYSLQAFDKLVVEVAVLPKINNLAKLLFNNATVNAYPLLVAGIAPPHWLKALDLQQHITYPCSTKHLSSTLNDSVGKDSLVVAESPFDSPFKILVAEDDEINQEIIHELVEQQGLITSIVNDGVEALQALEKSSFDLILMDIEMPNKGGVEVVEVLRAASAKQNYPLNYDIPVIAMTSHAMVGDRKRFLAAGMNDHISKPIDPNLLFSLMKQWLPDQNPIARKEELKPTDAKVLTIDGVDTQAGLERCNNNPKLYLKLLNRFANQYKTLPPFENLKIEELKVWFHSIKGSAANLGITEIASEASVLEQLCIKNEAIDDSKIKAFKEKLNTQCQTLLFLPT